MAVMGPAAKVEDGKLVYDYTDNSEKNKLPTGSKLGYDEFLQLLCAEMQYQDPLEPTSNTEYVAQLATFSQLEATLSLQNTQQGAMANQLVGKTVIMKITDDTTGAQKYVDGKVDYVMYQNGDIFVSVNDKLYPLSDLDTVADDSYYEAMGLAKSLENMLGQLPAVDNITAEYDTLISQITEMYDGMTDYQKTFVSDETAKDIKEYREKIEEEVKKAQTAADTISDKVKAKLGELPAVEEITLEDEEAVTEMIHIYNTMSNYQKTLVDEELRNTVDSYEKRLTELKVAAEA